MSHSDVTRVPWVWPNLGAIPMPHVLSLPRRIQPLQSVSFIPRRPLVVQIFSSWPFVSSRSSCFRLPVSFFRHSSFEFDSSFVICHSSFNPEAATGSSRTTSRALLSSLTPLNADCCTIPPAGHRRYSTSTTTSGITHRGAFFLPQPPNRAPPPQTDSHHSPTSSTASPSPQNSPP